MIRGEKGFTLIELVMVTVIIAIIAFIVGDSLIMGMKAYFVAEDRTEAIEKGRSTMERLEREIRNAIVIDNATASTTNLCFNDIYDRTVSFRYIGTDVTREQWASNISLCATAPNGAEVVLANDITAFAFAYNGTAGVESTPSASTKRVWISLTSTSGSESVQFESQVYPVNIW